MQLLITLTFDLTEEQATLLNSLNPATAPLDITSKGNMLYASVGAGEGSILVSNPTCDFRPFDPEHECLYAMEEDTFNSICEHASRYVSILSLTRQRKPFYRPRHPRTPRK